jgi:hypothetical protein
VATRRPTDEGDRTIWRAVREGVARGVDEGLADGVAHGLRRHLPGGVAIFVKGTPLCLMCAFMHFVLGIALPASAIAALLVAAGIGGIPVVGAAIRPAEGAAPNLEWRAPSHLSDTRIPDHPGSPTRDRLSAPNRSR